MKEFLKHSAGKTAETILLFSPQGPRRYFITRAIEKILISSDFQYEAGFDQAINEVANDEECGIEVVTNHTSHADAYPTALAGYKIINIINSIRKENKIKGLFQPYALSLDIGTQGHLLDVIFDDTQPLLRRLGITPIYTATANDIKEKRVNGSNAVEYTRTMIQGIKNGYGIAIFPEGKVEGGRRDGNGNIKGMQKFEDAAMQVHLRISATNNKRVAVFPVGISGGYNVYEPHGKSVPLEVFMVGIGLKNTPLYEVRIGNPIIFEKSEIRRMKSEDIDQLIGGNIKKLLPKAEQGSAY